MPVYSHVWRNIENGNGHLPATEVIIHGHQAVYRGILPKGGKAALLSVSGYVTEEMSVAMYLSALEASLSGWDVLTVAERRGMNSVLQGVRDGEGKLHVFTAMELDEYIGTAPGFVCEALCSGGSVTACGGRERSWLYALSFASCLITSPGRWPYPLETALDMGVPSAILRSSLLFPLSRRFASEGCPVIDTFSSFEEFPGTIAFPSSQGPYGFKGRFFSIMKYL